MSTTGTLIHARLPGEKLISKDGITWERGHFEEISTELNTHEKGVRIYSIESTYDRNIRLEKVGAESGRKDESLEIFSTDSVCRSYVIGTLNFPSCLFTEGWFKSNGFAGSKHLGVGNDIAWFRILVKMVKGVGKDDYCWHEMTFFISQSDSSGVIVLIFDMPDDIGPVMTPTSTATPAPSNGHVASTSKAPEVTEKGLAKGNSKAAWTPALKPYDFFDRLEIELNQRPTPTGSDVDWRYMQALLLKEAVVVVDRAVWACSQAVRQLEKARPDPTNTSLSGAFNFTNAHNLLRHALHLTETLQVASTNLNTWLTLYGNSQLRARKHQLRSSSTAPVQVAALQGPTDFEIGLDDLPESSHYDSLFQSLQLFTNLHARSISNEARLRNEIGLAFNLVSQGETRAMRIIGLVTLLFLPATFVSTFFSMSFFTWQQPDQAMSQWYLTKDIWIYFLVSGIFTILAILAWFHGEKWLSKLKGRWKKRKDA